MKTIPPEKFEEWLVNKQLTPRTVDNYMYYYFKFAKDHPLLDQESAVKFYSHKANRNSIGKTFLVNYRKFLMQNHKELKISIDELGDLVEMDLTSFKVGKKTHLVYPISHEDIPLLEKYLATERLKIQLWLTYSCGLRLGETLKVRFRSFNWDEWGKDMTKMGECRVLGKGGKPGIALVPGPIMNRISHFFQSSEFQPLTQNSLLFLKHTISDEEINVKNQARTWQMHLNQAGIKSGITKLDEHGKVIRETSVHPHRLRHCVKEGTEILTINGWKKRKELKVGELCPTLNLINDKIEFKPIKEIYVYNFRGNLFEIKNKYLHSQITPEHNCILKVGKERQKTINKRKKRWTELGNWELKTIKELLDEKNKRYVKYRISGISKGELSIGRARAGIIGWILTDGNKYQRCIIICQSLTANRDKCKIIENLLIKGKVKYSKKVYTQKKDSGFSKGICKNIVFRILGDSKDWIWEWINLNRTPKYKLLLLKGEELKAIYENMMLGDGSLGRELSTQNKKTIDFFRAMCCLLNYRTLLCTKKQNGKEYFRTYVTKRNDCQIRKEHIKKVDYVGKVWCPNIENNTWIARYNEKIFLTGNSYGHYLLNVKKLNLREVQELLRHTSITSTQIYTYIDKEKLKEKLGK